MRWDRLFDDLEGQLEQELEGERIDLVAEEERLRLGRLTLRDRVVAMAGSERRELDLVLRSGEPFRIAVRSTGRDWIAGEAAGPGVRLSCLVPLEAVVAVGPAADQLAVSLGAGVGIGGVSGPSAGTDLAARLGLPFVLRDLCRRRVAVDLVCDWATLHGTIDRVGRDHLDLAEHDPGEYRRAGSVRRVRIIALSALLRVAFD